MTTLKTIAYFTEKGGVNPEVRKAVKAQALKYAQIDLSNFELVGDTYVMPVAKDLTSGDTLYLKISATVGKASTEKKTSKKASDPVEIPNLFD